MDRKRPSIEGVSFQNRNWLPVLIFVLSIAALATAVIYVPHPGCQDHPMFYFQGTAFDCAAK